MYKKKYENVEDFVFDPSFKNWVVNRASAMEVQQWEEWALANPEKYELLTKAREIILALSVKQPSLDEITLDEVARKIIENIPLIEKPEAEVIEMNVSKSGYSLFNTWMKIAAVFIVMFSVGLFYYWHRTVSNPMMSYEAFGTDNQKNLIEFSNNTGKAQLFNLPDGSTATLEPKGKLSYSLTVDSANKYSKREVFLEGECFFNVQKNPSQPFIVFTSTVVTKVLGTSFRVRAYAKDKKATVEVSTGKVSVYKKEDFKKEFAKPNKLDGLILLPNQQIVYNSDKSDLVKSLVNNPIVLATQKTTPLSFNEAPLAEVFKKLENQYSIKIMYDEDVLKDCTFTATLGNENFYQKLNLICKSINSRYESIDGTIVIYSQGCK